MVRLYASRFAYCIRKHPPQRPPRPRSRHPPPYLPIYYRILCNANFGRQVLDQKPGINPGLSQMLAKGLRILRIFLAKYGFWQYSLDVICVSQQCKRLVVVLSRMVGHVANIYVNLEDWIGHIREGLAHLDLCPQQRLFQWDNGTDVVCWEPEYGGTRMLVDLFADQPEKYLELYVGKSDHIDFMLDYDHKGHTVCCWSLGTETQSRLLEQRSAGMAARIAAARKCQEAGYAVRFRLSPMIPIVGWRKEFRLLIARVFDETEPDLITMEPLRYYSHEALQTDFPPDIIDPEFVQAMAGIPANAQDWEKTEFPDNLRLKMYRLVLEEVAKRSPRTPVALCREKRRVWDVLADDLRRVNQYPDDYVCNCGPTSVRCDDRRPREAMA